MNKYFGTDGIRGVYGKELTNELATKAGRAIVKYFGKNKFVIARDSRVSGEILQNALVRGINAEGGSAYVIGIMPTPACAVLTKQLKGCCGIVISASHNPPEYNGIKLFDSNGLKLSEQREGEIEAIMENLKDRQCLDGKFTEVADAKNMYVNYITETCPVSLSGITVRLDCCFGATAGVAPRVFEKLGAKVFAYNNDHNGNKINVGVGALHPEWLEKKLENKSEIGFSFDGDGDRIVVLADGSTIDGDSVIYALSKAMTLNGNTVVGTILNNLALEQALNADGVTLKRTSVGDKYISNLMYEENYSLGGEQSGHFIINSEKGCPTGDAILSGAFLLNALKQADGTVKKIRRLELVPQKAIALYADKSIVASAGMQKLQDEAAELFGKNGRVIVRMSGTEPKVRVMAEATDEKAVLDTLNKFEAYIKEYSESPVKE